MLLDQNKKTIRVLYIAGQERSGSTILAHALGQFQNAIAIGEFVAAIPTYGLIENRLCGCGVSVRECQFWTPVFEEAFGGWQSRETKELIYLWQRVARFCNIPKIVSRLGQGTFNLELRAYTQYLECLYSAIQSISGADLIVDSSKSPTYTYILKTMSSIDLRILHLVRDSRAVAFSLTRKKYRPESTDKPLYLKQSGPYESAMRWMAFNLVLLRFQRSDKYIRVRYQDFVTKPGEWIGRISKVAGLDTPVPDNLLHGYVEIAAHHQIYGNPLRFNRGQVLLRVDDEWKDKMKPSDKFITDMLTWPLLRYFGYQRQ